MRSLQKIKDIHDPSRFGGPSEAVSLKVGFHAENLIHGQHLRGLQAIYTPAGSFHVSLMFGPIIIESGIEKFVLALNCS